MTRAAVDPESAMILLVEDEDAVREAIRDLLQLKGYKVLAAKDGTEALTRADHHRTAIHLLLTDVGLPDIDGGKLAECLRQRLPQLKVIYMSGYPEQALLRDGFSMTDGPFLQKPFTMAELVRKVKGVLERSEASPGRRRGPGRFRFPH